VFATVAACITVLSCAGDGNDDGDFRVETPAPTTTVAADVPTEGWRPIASSPLSPRSRSTSVWMGTEMLVVGGGHWVGEHDLGTGIRDREEFIDAAAYDPAADSWRRLPPPPSAPFGCGPVTERSS
jgi:hypothetical protein